MGKSIKYLFVFLGLLYFFSPVDLVRDYGLIGRIDDLLVIYYLWWQYRRLQTRLGRETDWTSRSFSGSSAEERVDKEGTEKKNFSDDAQRSPYQVLGVSRNSTDKQIQAAFRSLASQYHPDKVNHLGQELRAVAHQKMLEIQQAYEILSKD